MSRKVSSICIRLAYSFLIRSPAVTSCRREVARSLGDECAVDVDRPARGTLMPPSLRIENICHLRNGPGSSICVSAPVGDPRVHERHAKSTAPESGRMARSGARPPSRQLACKTGLPLDEVKRMLSLLAESGQVRSRRGGWDARPVPVVDTGADPQRARGLKLSWARAALSRLEAGEPGYAGTASSQFEGGPAQVAGGSSRVRARNAWHHRRIHPERMRGLVLRAAP